MATKHSLWAILVVSLCGVAFSGLLTYRDFLQQSNACTPLGQTGTILGYPPCIYGLVMYALVAALAGWGLAAKR